MITIYTDGSCDTALRTGAWAAIISPDSAEEVILQGVEYSTTHQRMELLAVIMSLEHVIANNMDHFSIKVCSDSQYVIKIENRKEAMKSAGFLTKKGLPVRNSDLVERLVGLMESLNIQFVKVKAHQKGLDGRNFNREADILCRKNVRKHRK